MDTITFYRHDTMYVISWYVVVAAGSLLLGLLVAAAVLIAWLFGHARDRR